MDPEYYDPNKSRPNTGTPILNGKENNMRHKHTHTYIHTPRNGLPMSPEALQYLDENSDG